MLLDRSEMTYDFGGERLDPAEHRDLLAWIFDQFLYGEMTGIQCGHWLHRAPDLDAARFLARQATEELKHVDVFLECLRLIGARPAPAHPLVRYLTTGRMPDTWAEHVCLEMAMGEGLVLMAFYAIIDTVDHRSVVRLLEKAASQEVRHVAFGESRTIDLVRARPALRRRLLGPAVASLLLVRGLARPLRRRFGTSAPVLRQLPAFVEAVARSGELRLQRMGLLRAPLSASPAAVNLVRIAASYAEGAAASLVGRPLSILRPPRLLTARYMADPVVRRYLMAVVDGPGTHAA